MLVKKVGWGLPNSPLYPKGGLPFRPTGRGFQSEGRRTQHGPSKNERKKNPKNAKKNKNCTQNPFGAPRDVQFLLEKKTLSVSVFYRLHRGVLFSFTWWEKVGKIIGLLNPPPPGSLAQATLAQQDAGSTSGAMLSESQGEGNEMPSQNASKQGPQQAKSGGQLWGGQ